MNQTDSLNNYLYVAFYNPKDKDNVEKYKDDIPVLVERYVPMFTVPAGHVFVIPYPKGGVQLLDQYCKNKETNDGTGT